MVFLADPSPKKTRDLSEIKKNHNPLAYQQPSSTSATFKSLYIFEKESSSPSPSSSSGSSKISPSVLFIIVILAVIFFISGLLHLLIRFLIKQPSSSSSSSSSSQSIREMSNSDALQRQLQQLFHLHDSGLDQAFIDALPVFHYKEIMGLKEPFDCAVCLCEFSQEEKLRLLPICSHAFHINCIDTWLLSNSTCPLCRGTLFNPGLAIENPVFDFHDGREEDGFSGDGPGNRHSSGIKPVEKEDAICEKRVLSVRLGKFRSLNDEGGGETGTSSSSSGMDVRRCYSMGSFQYVVGTSDLQVVLSSRDTDGVGGDGDGEGENFRRRSGYNGSFPVELDVEGKRLCSGSKGESLSVSKIWLWSKKGNFTTSSHTPLG